MNFTESVSYALSMLLMIVGMALVGVKVFFSAGTGVTIGIFAVLAAALLLMLLACRKKDERPCAFDFERKNIKWYAFCVAGAFLAEMVCSLLTVYDCYMGDTLAYSDIILYAVSAVTALFSAFLFVLVGMSYGGSNYDFRRIGSVAFAPLLWCMTRMSQSMTEYISVGKDVTATLKLLALLFLLLFFYRFAMESVKGETAAKSTLFFSGAVYIVCAMYWMAYICALQERSNDVNLYDFGLMLTALFVSCFALRFRRSIIDRC